MKRLRPRFGFWLFLSLALAMTLGSSVAFAQGRGGGTIVFLQRRPPRDLFGNIRAWAANNRATSYGEDTANHAWRVNFMVFLNRAPNVAEVIVSWFHIERDRTRRYVSNESISLANPGERIIFHSTSLHRAAGEFEPMENYEAVISLNDSHGVRELARGRVGLVGVVERHAGVVDFTGAQPVTR